MANTTGSQDAPTVRIQRHTMQAMRESMRESTGGSISFDPGDSFDLQTGAFTSNMPDAEAASGHGAVPCDSDVILDDRTSSYKQATSAVRVQAAVPDTPINRICIDIAEEDDFIDRQISAELAVPSPQTPAILVREQHCFLAHPTRAVAGVDSQRNAPRGSNTLPTFGCTDVVGPGFFNPAVSDPTQGFFNLQSRVPFVVQDSSIVEPKKANMTASSMVCHVWQTILTACSR